MTKTSCNLLLNHLLLVTLTILVAGCASIFDVAAYRDGTHITEVTLSNIVLNKTTAEELRNNLGPPSKIAAHDGTKQWYYDYTMISRFSKRQSECNIFIINSNNVVIGHYLSSRRATPTGNPSVDSAIEYYRW
jgi:outer membrane protein assembly factor BamE (lipoprotein component of BamABCDE complex)